MKTTPKTLITTLFALLIGGAAVAQTQSEPVRLDKKSIYEVKGTQVKMQSPGFRDLDGQTPGRPSQVKTAVNNPGLSKDRNNASIQHQQLLYERKQAASRGESTEKYDAVINEYYQKAKQ